MNPSSSEGLNLPVPVGETAAPLTPETSPSASEKAPSTPERGRQVSRTAPTILPLPPLATPDPVTPATAAGKAGAAQTTPVAMADDGDLIEKEWVEKAKAIVERTRNNPYQQSEELTEVKADYMKRRYDKALKVKP